MSESFVRKTQPFTIGTKLSAPPAPQCSGFPDGYLSNRTFTNNCQLRHLNEQVSLYLGRSQVCDRRPGPPTSPVSPVKHHLEHLNRNTVSPNAASRSIRKITLSSGAEARLSPSMELKKISPNSENINNNNNITANTQLPKIVGVSCENKPKPHFKVLLCKDGEKQCSGDQEKFSASLQTQSFKTQTTRHDVPKLDSPLCEHKDTCVASKASSAQNEHSFVQQNALFNKEMTQAEAWIRAKLRDLRDDSNIQRCPLMDWDDVCQTLQRDLKDFENNVIHLNLMGEQLMCNLNPTSDLVKKQLAQLHDQWSTLKQTIAIQITAMGGAKCLQEFNKKVDRLEAWIQEKEEEQSLANILGENIDKMQLTRKILDLKQDEQLYRNLHEEINHMAIRLEKQGRTEGKSISTRRKHVNKMWQKAQSHSRDYHENLLLALDVSSFIQQADNLVCSINNMTKGLSLPNVVETSRDVEIRDIASQIMMLNVNVSQLSNLHPALASRVMQKQSEVKDCWSLLQNIVRNEKATRWPSAPLLTKEASDPETQSQELPGSVGTDQGRIMGKEVKEDRLKGFTGGRDCERFSKPSDSQADTQQCAAESPARVCASDFTVRLQTASESGNPAGPESRGHPALHTQLQRFSVSADKTLSWLKDSVTMATQICNLSGPRGFEAAKRCQATLEQDILSNRARIELVKREGHSLVRAQHTGSTKIQEFLSQLEVLWEELKRRHQRNGLVLQVSEELNCRVVRVLQSLCSLEVWLEAVELSIRQASLVGDPESVSVAEQESCQLERELQDRRLELQNLRQEVHHLSTQRHLHTQLLPARLRDVEEKFSSVQAGLTQQSSELKDTRMLTEFLEKVELEESNCSTLGEPLCGDLDSGPSLLGSPGNGHDEPLMESVGNPVEELREAVEMLNDTARERGRSQSHDQSIQELLSRHSMLSVRVEQCLQRCAELTEDVLEMESEMAVRCEPDRCGLDRLQEYQDKLEAEYKVLQVEMEAVENLAGRLTDVCPERMHTVRRDTQSSLYGWQELNKSLAENRRRLLQSDQLRQFFRNYLAMISWTEDTRSCIFSESDLRQEPLVEVLDRQIEQKFEEFDQLTVTGKKLFDDKHHLNKMIQERMEELRSMLGWILVHWRAQKDQLLTRHRAEEAHADAIYSEATVCTVQPQLETSPEDSQKKLESLSALPADLEDTFQHSDGYEVMMSVSPRGSDVSSNIERPDSPYLMMKEPSSPSLGGTVNLILSFSNSGDTQVQVQEPGRKGGVPVPEPVHRVSTYLHVTDNNTAIAPVYESMTLPRSKTQWPSSSPRTSPYSFSSPCNSPNSSSCNEEALIQANNSLHLLPKSGNISIFSSLKRKKKKKKDDHRHTIQKIMGEEPSGEASMPPVCEPATYNTNTWPLKKRKKGKNARKPKSDGIQVLDYMKNPLVQDIDAECSREVGSPVEHLKITTQGNVKNHCRFLSLGSVLSFDLPKDMSLIPSVQDVITIGSAKPKTDPHHQDSHAERPTDLCTFKLARSPPMQKDEPKHMSPGEMTLRIDCKDAKNISVETVSFTEENFPPPPSPVIEDIAFDRNHTSLSSDLIDVQLKCLSGISRLPKEENNLDTMPTHLDHKEDHTVSPPEHTGQGIANHSHSLTTAEIRVLCPSVHTLIHNLNGHVFHKAVKTLSSQPLRDSPNPPQNQASNRVLNFRANERDDSIDSGHSSSGSFKICAEGPFLETSECPVSKRTMAKVPSLEAEVSKKNLECSMQKNLALAIDDTVHPDHQQFEQEEEELEDIWNHTNSYRQSVSSDIMYNGYQTLPESSSPDQDREASPKEQAVLFRKLITASAPDLLVAEFRLPSSIQNFVGCGKQQDAKEEACVLGNGDRRSWAALTQQEKVYKQVAVNETASDPVKMPEIEEYIYHYTEEEEDEEKESGFLEDPSMSRLSVHMGLETDDSDIQSVRQELPSMEGTLERKHKLQLGGKKALCRTWNSYHAVLYKQTMCFYEDQKDALRSCATSLPLNLIGAVCEPSPEYTKKPNCFCLRLRDKSEYLLSASSQFMMKKWILRIQAHTVLCESGVNRSTCHGPSAQTHLPRHSPSLRVCQCADKCLCSMRSYVSSTVLAQSQSASGRTKEIIVHTTDGLQRDRRHQDLVLTSSSGAGHCEDEFDSHGESLRHKLSAVSSIQGWTSEKRRSHSFTSATYQRIKPVLAPPTGRGQDNSPSYSVTLFIGDREATSVCTNTVMDQTNGVSQESISELPLRSYTSLPRPRNKSVFRKFFGKKE